MKGEQKYENKHYRKARCRRNGSDDDRQRRASSRIGGFKQQFIEHIFAERNKEAESYENGSDRCEKEG